MVKVKVEYLNKLDQLKFKQQQQLEIALSNLNRNKDNIIVTIKNITTQITNNDVAKKKWIREFYANSLNTKSNSRSFANLSINIEKFDLQKKELLERKEEELNSLHLTKEQIKNVQQQIRELIIKQEKYKHLLTNNI